MEREQFKVLVKGMKAVYTEPKFIPDADAFNVWYSLLKDLDYDVANAAVQKYMLINKFPPTIADVREQSLSLISKQEMNETEAWSLVSRALRRGNYYAEEEYDKLPREIQKAVGSPDNLRNWAKADEQSVETVIQSNFMRAYRTELSRGREYKKLPFEMKQLIAGTERKLEDKHGTSDEAQL